MKMLCLLCVLFTVAAFQPSTPAQSLGGGLGGDNSIDSLHNTITKTPFTYIKGIYTLSIKFKGNGTGECTDWTFKWHAKDAQTIELTMLDEKQRPTDKKTTLLSVMITLHSPAPTLIKSPR
jgi:hypothetical protein